MAVFEIEKALFKGVEELNLTYPRNYPNVPSENQAPFADVTVSHDVPQSVTLGKIGEDNHTGFLQIMLKFTLGEGNSPIMTAAGELRGAFQAGAKYIYQGQVVVVTMATIGTPVEMKSLYCLPVTVYWYSRSTRSLP
jgi:hypothetical protein